MNKKYLEFNLGFINHDIVVTRSKKQYKKLTGYKVPKDITGLNYLKSSNTKQSIVYIANDLEDLTFFFTSIHEATHVVDDIFDIYGFQDRELRAYLQEYISSFFYYDSKSLLKDK